VRTAAGLVATAFAAVLGAQEPAAARQDGRAAAQAGVDKALEFFVKTQNPDGSWGSTSCETTMEMVFAIETHYAWSVAAHGLATMTLLQAKETPERRAALDKAVRWLCNSRMTLRGSTWDNDAVWGWLYGTVAMTEIARDARFSTDEWRGPVGHRGREFAGWLQKNQEPLGGFGYYDDPPFTQRPKWGTSFSTASVLPALGIALQLGWLEDSEVRDRAAGYIRKCRLPNGAYQYDLGAVPRMNGGEHINDVKGSLGRIQVCNWALRRAGDPAVTDQVIEKGLQQFFEHHRFLAIARMRPIPHEAYYYVAAYFYMFGHCYAAQAINELPEAERADWHRQLRSHLAKIQWDDGSSIDFPNMSCMQIAGTSFSILAFQAGLPGSHVRL